MMNVTIIIPNYNGARFLPACLHSLRRQTYRNFSVIVVDNGSTDHSATLLEDNYPNLKVIRFSENRGFAAAANAGIMASVTPYVMLLNNDTILAPDCLLHLVKAIEKSSGIFSVGARILTMKEPYLTDTTGDFYTLFGYAFCRDQGLSHCKCTPGEVFTNCGCAVLYRRSLLFKTGLFDARFFAYLEDVDLGIRARALGYQNLYCPQAVVRHYGSGTTKEKYTEFKVFHSARNNLRLRRKNLTLFQRILHFPFTFTGTVLKYFYFRKIGLHKAYFRGLVRDLPR